LDWLNQAISGIYYIIDDLEGGDGVARTGILTSMSSPKTLLVSRDPSLIKAVRGALLSTRGFELEVVSDVEAACKGILGHDEVLVTLVHLDETTNVAGLTGILQAAAEAGRPVATIAIGDHENPEQGLAMARLGVAECLSRPLNLGRLAYLIDTLTIEARYAPRRAPVPGPAPCEVLALGNESPFLFVSCTRMGRMVEQIKRIAPLDTSVMLGGETGTGKTHLAGVIHRLSPRRDEPFLTINCGALAANLIESEMFGHVRGAFTGADAERTGKLAAVGRGTLFLDEVDSLPPGLQAKLLRVVEERAFEPVGSNKTMRLRARLIVASNRPLEQEVAAGRFRADLFYRFNVVAFEIPPLRERARLIPGLARSLLAESSARNGRRTEGIAPAAMQALVDYSWPGNVRELRNVIERAVALCPGDVIELDDLPDYFQRISPTVTPTPASGGPPAGFGSTPAADRFTPGAGPDAVEGPPFPAAAALPVTGPMAGHRADEVSPPVLKSALAESKERAELSIITQALERNGHNRLRAAAELGISRMTLYKKLHKYGLMGA
jgi:DNA-binding NtrC family response regulator